jgi:hypothetical protein
MGSEQCIRARIVIAMWAVSSVLREWNIGSDINYVQSVIEGDNGVNLVHDVS